MRARIECTKIVSRNERDFSTRILDKHFKPNEQMLKKYFGIVSPFFIFHTNFSFLSFLWIVKLVGGKIGTSVIIIGKIFPLIFVSKILFGSHRNRKKLIGISKENFFVNDNYVQNFITFLFLFFLFILYKFDRDVISFLTEKQRGIPQT